MKDLSSVKNRRIFFRELALDALTPLEQRVLQRDIQQLVDTFAVDSCDVTLCLKQYIEDNADRRRNLVLEYRAMEQDLGILSNKDQRIDRMMAFLETITHPEQLAEDRRAFHRWMDEAAVRERARNVLHYRERQTEIVIRMLAEWLSHPENKEQCAELIHRLDISSLLLKEFQDSPRVQNRRAVLSFWNQLLMNQTLSAPPDRWRWRIKEIVADVDENVWVQLEAFEIFARYDPGECITWIQARLSRPANTRDDRFLRSGLLRLTQTYFQDKTVQSITHGVLFGSDPSEHVRIAAARRLKNINRQSLIDITRKLLRKPEETAKVRAAALLALRDACRRNKDDHFRKDAADVFFQCLDIYHDGFDAWIAVNSLMDTIPDSPKSYPTGHVPESLFEVLQKTDRIIEDNRYSPRIRRAASYIRETLILSVSREALELKSHIETFQKNSLDAGRYLIPGDIVENEDTLGRVMAWCAATNLNLSAERDAEGYMLIQGDRFTRRLWRILDELRHPDPAKRQGFPHSIGRKMVGSIRAPSRLLFEMTASKVPGERLFIPTDQSWRPYLPTVDDLLSLCSGKYAGKTVRIYCSEGVISMSASKNISDRLMLKWELTMNYRDLAELRNRDYSGSNGGSSRTFISVLSADYNIDLSFTPHAYIFGSEEYRVMDPLIADLWSPLWKPHTGSEGGLR